MNIEAWNFSLGVHAKIDLRQCGRMIIAIGELLLRAFINLLKLQITIMFVSKRFLKLENSPPSVIVIFIKYDECNATKRSGMH